MITGTLINYYLHCKRQCWLFYNRMNMEDNSEDVHIGRVLHDLQNKDEKSEVTIDSIKLDKITEQYVVELKKSDADLEAAKTQLLYYLYILREKGIERKGKLHVVEKQTQDKMIHIIHLNDQEVEKIKILMKEIQVFLEQEQPPKAVMKKGCKKCAYYEYCYL